MPGSPRRRRCPPHAAHRQQDFAGALVAAHDLELGAAIGVERQREQHRGRAAAGGAGSYIALGGVLERPDAGGGQRRADVDIGGEAAEIAELAGVELGRAADHGRGERLRQAAERGAVLRRHLGHVLGGDEAAGARHVLRQDRRVARNAGAGTRRRAGRVVAAARSVADEHADGLAAVEVGDRIGLELGRRSDQQGGCDQSSCGPFHRAILRRTAQRAASALARQSAHGRAAARSMASLLVIASSLVRKLIGPPMVMACSCRRALTSV